MNEITIYSVPAGDWEALYVNGILQHENHEIRICDLSMWCPIESIKTIYLRQFDEDDDSFPEFEADIPSGWVL